MKAGKVPGPSGIVVMIGAADDTGTSMICDLAATIIHGGKVPSDWEQSFIVCLKGKGGALERGNYHGLKLTFMANCKTYHRICLQKLWVHKNLNVFITWDELFYGIH